MISVLLSLHSGYIDMLTMQNSRDRIFLLFYYVFEVEHVFLHDHMRFPVLLILLGPARHFLGNSTHLLGISNQGTSLFHYHAGFLGQSVETGTCFLCGTSFFMCHSSHFPQTFSLYLKNLTIPSQLSCFQASCSAPNPQKALHCIQPAFSMSSSRNNF
jgi:hypothetical protein